MTVTCRVTPFQTEHGVTLLQLVRDPADPTDPATSPERIRITLASVAKALNYSRTDLFACKVPSEAVTMLTVPATVPDGGDTVGRGHYTKTMATTDLVTLRAVLATITSNRAELAAKLLDWLYLNYPCPSIDPPPSGKTLLLATLVDQSDELAPHPTSRVPLSAYLLQHAVEGGRLGVDDRGRVLIPMQATLIDGLLHLDVPLNEAGEYDPFADFQ